MLASERICKCDAIFAQMASKQKGAECAPKLVLGTIKSNENTDFPAYSDIGYSDTVRRLMVTVTFFKITVTQ